MPGAFLYEQVLAISDLGENFMGKFRYYGKRIVNWASRPLPYGVQDAALNLYSEMETFLVHQNGKWRARKFRQAKDLKLHLGCGANYKQGWVNIDIGNKVDLNLDLRRPLPLPSQCCQVIYSEHFLEHIGYPQPAQLFLSECYRVLMAGGLLSISVPDTELILNSYVHGGTDAYYAAQEKWNPAWCQTRMDHVNFSFRQNGNHHYAYDYETLAFILDKAGFSEIKRRSYDPGLDREDRIVGSLYVECCKAAEN